MAIAPEKQIPIVPNEERQRLAVQAQLAREHSREGEDHLWHARQIGDLVGGREFSRPAVTTLEEEKARRAAQNRFERPDYN